MHTIVSGARPTGSLHLGNYAGAVSNWLRLQEEGHRCYYFIADYHALTTGFMDTSQLSENTATLLSEYLALGIDPEKVTLFVQSDVRAHAELTLILSMLTPISWLERNPAYKDLLANLDQQELRTAGFLGYPTLMAADILLYRADFVPVAQDQLAHLELTREIARRFNHLYDGDLIEPQALHIQQALLRGIDGRKMSKSYHNTIAFADSPEVVAEKIRRMVTDPARIHRTDPGDPDVCSVYDLHKVFNSEDAPEIGRLCRAGEIGCVACKKRAIEAVARFHTPVHEKSVALRKDRAGLARIAAEGAVRARTVADEALAQAREAIGFGF